jgi:hypothetical protein
MSGLSLGVPDRPAPCIPCYISLRIPPSLDLEQGTIVTATQPRISEQLLGPVILPPDEFSRSSKVSKSRLFHRLTPSTYVKIWY